MRQLLLMRHAKAVREPGVSDHARALNERGRADAARVARFLNEHGWTPDGAVASDSRRTRETLDLAAGLFDPVPPMRLDRSLYLAEPREMLRVIRATPPSVRRLLVVGHNPGVAELAVALTGRGPSAQVRALASSFPTAAVAVLDFEGEWSSIRELDGRLERFVLAKPLREAAGDAEREE